MEAWLAWTDHPLDVRTLTGEKKYPPRSATTGDSQGRKTREHIPVKPQTEFILRLREGGTYRFFARISLSRSFRISASSLIFYISLRCEQLVTSRLVAIISSLHQAQSRLPRHTASDEKQLPERKAGAVHSLHLQPTVYFESTIFAIHYDDLHMSINTTKIVAYEVGNILSKGIDALSRRLSRQLLRVTTSSTTTPLS